MWNWFKQNVHWIFSGVGVAIFLLVLDIIRRKRRKKASGDHIVTHGDFSPGKVGGDYEVKINEKDKD